MFGHSFASVLYLESARKVPRASFAVRCLLFLPFTLINYSKEEVKSQRTNAHIDNKLTKQRETFTLNILVNIYQKKSYLRKYTNLFLYNRVFCFEYVFVC